MGEEEVNSQDWVIGCSIRVLTKHTKEVGSTANAAAPYAAETSHLVQ